MYRTMMKSKIHRATVTQADLHYVGSVTVDEDLMDAADLLAGEQVAIVDVTNGARLETYVIAGPRGSGVIGINGAAARLVHPATSSSSSPTGRWTTPRRAADAARGVRRRRQPHPGDRHDPAEALPAAARDLTCAATRVPTSGPARTTTRPSSGERAAARAGPRLDDQRRRRRRRLRRRRADRALHAASALGDAGRSCSSPRCTSTTARPAGRRAGSRRAVAGGQPEDHLQDTLVAGRRAVRRRRVRVLCTEGPGRLRELVALGAAFDRDPSASCR
jgi:hypothetical protein